MKKTVTYREITVAIGIVVAMVIVLTLWIRVPVKTAPQSEDSPRFELRFSTKDLVDITDLSRFNALPRHLELHFTTPPF